MQSSRSPITPTKSKSPFPTMRVGDQLYYITNDRTFETPDGKSAKRVYGRLVGMGEPTIPFGKSQCTHVIKTFYSCREVLSREELAERKYFSESGREAAIWKKVNGGVVSNEKNFLDGVKLTETVAIPLVKDSIALSKVENLTIADIKSIALLVAKELKRIHELGIIHFDIKPANILLKKPYPPFQIVIVDFGEAREFGEKVEANVGTNFFMAPEVKFPFGRAIGLSVSKECACIDCYSLGKSISRLCEKLNPPPEAEDPDYILLRRMAEGLSNPLIRGRLTLDRCIEVLEGRDILKEDEEKSLGVDSLEISEASKASEVKVSSSSLDESSSDDSAEPSDSRKRARLVGDDFSEDVSESPRKINKVAGDVVSCRRTLRFEDEEENVSDENANPVVDVQSSVPPPSELPDFLRQKEFLNSNQDTLSEILKKRQAAQPMIPEKQKAPIAKENVVPPESILGQILRQAL